MLDENGFKSNGLLSLEDFHTYETRIEEPVSVVYRGLKVYKPGPWSQGPVFLQQLRLLEYFDLSSMGFLSSSYIHTVVEASKLAFADREKYYGDPNFVDVPLEGLLSERYNNKRHKLIDSRVASLKLRPGNPYPYQSNNSKQYLNSAIITIRSGEDTTGTRAVDTSGNMFSATPSGGWVQSSPLIEGLGFPLNTRCQMFWIGDPDHPNSLKPFKRPRTTLTPSLVMKDNYPFMVFGTPGGDYQDQWSLQFFLNYVDFGMDIQQAVDAPCFSSDHFPSSFYPRTSHPAVLSVENRIPEDVRKELAEKGHKIKLTEDWSQGFTTAVSFDVKKHTISGGASSRWPTNYAIGW